MSDNRLPQHIWLIAGEESGDQLGGKLMRALKEKLGPNVRFEGVGGHAMEEEGLKSLFPLADIAVMGLSAVIRRLPTLLRRIRETADAVVAARPDILVIIDSPDFTHRVAKRVRARLSQLPIVDYVSPSVWAWRPGRAKAMAGYIDHVLAILPFEPEEHLRLGGPPCSYTGHPLIERVGELRPSVGERSDYRENPFRLIVLPGSRWSEVNHLMGPFGEAVSAFTLQMESGHNGPPRKVEIVLPAVPRLAEAIKEKAASWTVSPTIVIGHEAKLAAFRSAHLALAASGTVTLELALSGVPMVVAYKVSKLEEQLRFLVKASSIVLANLVLRRNIVPELIQEDCTGRNLAGVLWQLARETQERLEQEQAFVRLDELMSIGSETPSERAARIVCETYDAVTRKRATS